MSLQPKSGRRAVLKDNSWIKRKAEEDEPIDHDPNFGKVVLSHQKSVDDVSSKPVEAEKPAVNSGTSFSSLSKSVKANTSSGANVPPVAPKPPVPVKNPGFKTPTTSGFTARVFSGANTSSKTLSPVKPSFGEKFPEFTASQSASGLNKSSTAAPPSPVTFSPSAAPAAATSTDVKSSVNPPTVKSPTRSESVSVSTLVSKSSTASTSQTTVTYTKTSSSTLDETLTTRPAEKPSASRKLSDVSSSPSAVTLNTRYSYQTPSAPLDDLADTLMPSLSGSVQSVRSQTQVRTVYTEVPAASPTLRSPLQTLESSSRPVSSRDACTVCGKPIAGAERMILEELKIISHASCFRCAVCHSDLGGLEAGKSLWVHRERVNCSNCFSKIRGQWYI